MKLLTLTALYKFGDLVSSRCWDHFQQDRVESLTAEKCWRALFYDMLEFYPRSDKLVKLTPTLTSRVGDQYVGEMDYSSNGE
jgi:hypothetical protein